MCRLTKTRHEEEAAAVQLYTAKLLGTSVSLPLGMSNPIVHLRECCEPCYALLASL